MRPLNDAMHGAVRWAGWAALCALAGCGGGQTGGGASDAGPASVQVEAQAEGGVTLLGLVVANEEPQVPPGPQAPVRMKPPSLPEALKAADVGDARREDRGLVHLTLIGPEGAQASSLELAPVRGVGYPSVRARVSSVRTNGHAPVASLRAQCPSASECTFRAPLPDGAERMYVLRIPQDSAARLLSGEAEGEVLVVAQQVAVPQRTVVTLTLESGRQTSSARVAYLGPDATRAATVAPAPAEGTVSASPLHTPASRTIESPTRRYPFAPRS